MIGFARLIVPLFLGGLLLCGCAERPPETNTSSNNNSAAPAIVSQIEIKKSVARAGGSISARTRVLTDIVVGEPVTIELTLGTQPYEDLELDIASSESHQLQGQFERVLPGSDSGVIKERVELVPLVAGKQYLRMTVAQEGGYNPRSVVVALPVKDLSGTVPVTQKPIKTRVEFESLPTQ